ncbi:unnamed protein product, partial [Mycena citricolor]
GTHSLNSSQSASEISRKEDIPRLGRLSSFLFKIRLQYGGRKYWTSGPVTRLNRELVVKRTWQVALNEALTIRFIAANTTIPVPRVHRIFVDRGTRNRGHYTEKLDRLNVVMDYVEGCELESVWDAMGVPDRLVIMEQLREYLSQLRALKPPRPGYIEAVDGGPCRDFRIESDGDGFGPFSSVDVGFDAAALAFHRCLNRTYQTSFAHCDIAPRNILVKGNRIVAIVDWEMAGWYPEYWEYTQTYFSNTGLMEENDFY